MAAVSSLLLAAVAGASVIGGVQSYKEGQKQADLAIAQASKAAAETKRQTDRSATLEERNIKDTTEREKLAYLASGVTLEGSPLLKLEETRQFGAENLQEIRMAGDATAEAQMTEGRTAARAAKSAGRAALISGITGAAKAGAGAF